MSRTSQPALVLSLVAAISGSAVAGEAVRVIYPGKDRAVVAALARPADEVYSARLRDILEEITRSRKIPIIIDEVALVERAGVLERRVDADAQGLDLKSALTKLLATCDLAFLVEDGVLKVTTAEAAADHMLLRAYDVAPLLGEDRAQGDVDDLSGAVSRLVELQRAETAGPGYWPVPFLGEPDSLDASRSPGIVAFRTRLVVIASPADHDRVVKALEILAEVGTE